ncbi:hypothetical protein INT48_003071 [Thamnidium elegans]|uniref:Uncharacterized protein n=1 Tax=Thamnidium elegans TaxID=101142 RepID=A0A8H7SI95_9FUNG|nr:hypothetical protein INT48_003071 [Thamnidium elegans]
MTATSDWDTDAMYVNSSDSEIDFNPCFSLPDFRISPQVDCISNMETYEARERLNHQQRQASREHNNVYGVHDSDSDNASEAGQLTHVASRRIQPDRSSDSDAASEYSSDSDAAPENDLERVSDQEETSVSYNSDENWHGAMLPDSGESEEEVAAPVFTPAAPNTYVYSNDSIGVVQDTVEMSFAEYVEGCLNASTGQEKLDWLMNGFSRDSAGNRYPFVVNMESNDDSLVSDLEYSQDVDAFIACNTETISLKEGIKDVPHTLFLTAEAYGKVDCFISFPAMYEEEIGSVLQTDSDDSDDENDVPQIRKKKQTFLDIDHQRYFVDKLLLPAFKNVCDAYTFTNIPSSFSHAASNGYLMHSTDFISSTYIHLAIAEMRRLILLDTDLLIYEDFFFNCSSFGSKQKFTGDLDSILGSVIDWTCLTPSKVYVDVATSVWNKNRVSSFFLRQSSQHYVPRYYYLDQEDKKKFFPASLASFGGLSVKPKIVGKADLYTGFTGKHFRPMGLWLNGDKQTVSSHQWYKNRFEENTTNVFPLRIEGRYSADRLLEPNFLALMELNASSIYENGHILEIDTALYFTYLNARHLQDLFPVVFAPRVQAFNFSVFLQIKNRRLRNLVGHFDTTSASGCGLGTPYVGVNFYTESNLNISGLYFEKTNNMFQRYGLGVESAGRFLEIFFEEYMALINNKFLKPEFHDKTLSFDCFLYQATETPFVQVTKNCYQNLKLLPDRFNHMLPLVDSADFGNASVVKEKVINAGGLWANFGCRAAYLQLYLNECLSPDHMTLFRLFFFLSINQLFEFVPMNNNERLLYSYRGIPRLQRTIPQSKMTDRRPDLQKAHCDEIRAYIAKAHNYNHSLN